MTLNTIYQDGSEFLLKKEGDLYQVYIDGKKNINFKMNSDNDAIIKFETYVRSLL